MKYWMLQALLPHWPAGRLKEARRCGENQILLRFMARTFLVDLTGANALIVPDLEKGYAGVHFNAPFDVLLHKHLSGSDLSSVRLDSRDKVLFLHFVKSGGYKNRELTLVLELTGRHTNAVLLDDSGTTLEALHHIKNQIRHIAPQHPYKPPPPPPRAPMIESCPDILALLRDRFTERTQSRFENQKADRLRGVHGRIEHFQKLLDGLSDPQALQYRADRARLEGSLILANLHQIPGYATKVDLEDFEGQAITLALPKAPSAQQMAQMRFKEARRLEAKARGLFQEQESLRGRLLFYQRLYQGLQEAQDPQSLLVLMPQKTASAKERVRRHEPIETFLVESFSVLLGRNETGNALLLKQAKATDLWLHMQDRPSAHVIIRTNRQNIPPNVIDRAASLCVRFSVSQKGNYLVDYTTRRYVKIVQKAQVNYTHQKTVAVTI